MDVFDCNVVLFESEDLEEGIVVECTVGRDGSLVVLQESYGPLTAVSFGESPHRVELVAGPAAVRALLAYFHLDSSWQLPFVLRFECAGVDSCLRVRELLQRLGLPFEEIDEPAAA